MSDHDKTAGMPGWGPPYLLYMGAEADHLAIKTARGLAYWRPQWCLGQYRSRDNPLTLGLPDMTPARAKAAGADTMVIGIANVGGQMTEETIADIIIALDAGLNVIAGLHQKLRDNKDIVAAARRNGRTLFDAREATRPSATAAGARVAGC